MIRLYLILGGLIFLASCVPNKKIVYLQKNDVNKKNLVKDSVLREYSLMDFDYRIQPFDALYVRFESLTDEEYDFFSKSQGASNAGITSQGIIINSELVDEEGRISFPVIGKIKVAGLTLFETQDTLQTIANRYLESPAVKVRLVNFRVTILGEVNHEGTVTTFNPRTSLPEALGLVGGISELADRANVKIIRQRGDRTEVAYVNLLDEELMNSPYYYVTQNDVIIVPPLRQRPFRRYFSQNLGILLSSASVILLILNLTTK